MEFEVASMGCKSEGERRAVHLNGNLLDKNKRDREPKGSKDPGFSVNNKK